MRNKSIFLSFYFLLLFVYTAASTSLLTVTDWAPWYFSGIPLVISVIVALKYRVNLFNKRFILLLFVLIAWNVAQYVINHVTPSPYAMMLVVIVWVAFNVFHDDFDDRFIRTTTYLASISLLVWPFCVLAQSMMLQFGENFGIETMNVSYSFVFFNINKGSFYRNCGFCWEPGRYSCFLIIALFLYYIKYGFSKRTTSFYILMISILSTFSTTGYIVLGFFLVYHFLKKKTFNPIYWILLVVLFIWVWSLPFMSEKIQEFAAEGRFDHSVEIAEWNVSNGTNDHYTPQRFDGFLFQVMNVMNMNPIIGDSHNHLNYYINKVLSFNIVSSEGILFMILCYGVIIGFFCYFYLYKSSVYWGRKYGFDYKLLFFFLFIIMNFSYNFWEFPLFMTIWLWTYFEPKNKQKLCKYEIINNNS